MIRAGQLRAYGSVEMPEDNVSTVGGGIDLTTAVDFSDPTVNDQLLVASTDSRDTQNVTVTFRAPGGAITPRTVTLTGTTPVLMTDVVNRIMKVVKQGSTFGDIAVEQLTPTLEGVLRDVQSDAVTLDTAASEVSGSYTSLVFRITGGTGVGNVAKVIGYDGLTRIATLDRALNADSTSTYRLSPGVVLSKTPNEIFTVRRPFYNVIADISGGVDRIYCEKIFLRNDSGQSLLLAQVSEIFNPTGRIKFGVDPVDPSVSGVSNRLLPPVINNLTLGRLPQAASASQSWLSPEHAAGVWLSFAVPAGQLPIRSFYVLALTGTT